MSGVQWDHDLVLRFEKGLDLKRPERSTLPARVLAHGRFSTVFALTGPGAPEIVLKRLTMFRTLEEFGRYRELHRGYVRLLGERAGLSVAPVALEPVAMGSRLVAYAVQPQAPVDTLAHMAVYRLPALDINRLLFGVLEETAKVFAFNNGHRNELELGFDARFSNWALVGFDPEEPALPQRIRLTYLDTTPPMMRRRGQEQFDAQLLVRGMPRALSPFLWRYGLADMMSRPYDLRRVSMDMLADFSREGRAELLPQLVDSVNWFHLAEQGNEHFRRITLPDVESYARWDAVIWRAAHTLRTWARTA